MTWKQQKNHKGLRTYEAELKELRAKCDWQRVEVDQLRTNVQHMQMDCENAESKVQHYKALVQQVIAILQTPKKFYSKLTLMQVPTLLEEISALRPLAEKSQQLQNVCARLRGTLELEQGHNTQIVAQHDNEVCMECLV